MTDDCVIGSEANSALYAMKIFFQIWPCVDLDVPSLIIEVMIGLNDRKDRFTIFVETVE